MDSDPVKADLHDFSNQIPGKSFINFHLQNLWLVESTRVIEEGKKEFFSCSKLFDIVKIHILDNWNYVLCVRFLRVESAKIIALSDILVLLDVVRYLVKIFAVEDYGIFKCNLFFLPVCIVHIHNLAQQINVFVINLENLTHSGRKRILSRFLTIIVMVWVVEIER